MRILCPIVQALMLAMLNVKLHFPARRGVGLEFVGDHDAWRLNGAFQEFRQEALRRSAVSPFLDQNVENKAVLIDRAPEPVSFAGDGNDDLVQMPFIATRRSPAADLIGKCAAELVRPSTHGLVAHAYAARRQHLFDHAEAQRKPKIEPDRRADNFRRKAMTAIKRSASI